MFYKVPALQFIWRSIIRHCSSGTLIALLLCLVYTTHSFPNVERRRFAIKKAASLQSAVMAMNSFYPHDFHAEDIKPTPSPSLQMTSSVMMSPIKLDICKWFVQSIPISTVNQVSITSLLDEKRNPVSRNSLIQFNRRTYEVYGILSYESHSKYKALNNHFILSGKNSNGFESEVHFDLILPSFIKRSNYNIILRLKIIQGQDKCMVDNILEVMSKIQTYFHDDDLSKIYPISFNDDNDVISFEWSNHSLEYPSCSDKVIDEMSRKIFDKDGEVVLGFREAFEPQFRLLGALEKRLDFCLPRLVTSIIDKDYREAFINSLTSLHNVGTKKHRQKRNAINNTAPVPRNDTLNLKATYCSLLYYQLSENLFIDREEGTTRHLTLRITPVNESKAVAQDSWLQLESTLQVIFGYLKPSDAALADSNNTIHYRLHATDSSGLTASIDVNIEIPSFKPKIFYKIELTTNHFEDQEKADFNEQIFLTAKIISYFGDSFFWSVNILSFERNVSANQITFGWSNCSLSGDTCPEEIVNTLISRVISKDGKPNSAFESKLQPQYKIYRLRATKVGECAALASSVSATLTTPVPSKAPQINLQIPELTVTTTAYFMYQIPSLTFFDAIDGYTRSLSLQLRTATNISISRSSWLQFNTSSQTMYGILTSGQFTNSFVKIFQFMLLATNTRGYSSHLMINLKGSRQSLAFGAEFSISGRDNSENSANDIQILSKILTNLRVYLKETADNTIEVVKFERKLLGQQRTFTLVYANTTITTSNCAALLQITPFLESQGDLINPSLTVALSPDVFADRVDIKRHMLCTVSSFSTVMPSPTLASLAPELKNEVPVINVTAGLYFYYQISVDTFYDVTDGDTRNLLLQLTHVDGGSLNSSSWIQFDRYYQHIYGLLSTSLQTKRPYQSFTFILTSQNSRGYTTTQNINIRSQYNLDNIGIEVILKGREYSTLSLNTVQLQISIIKQLKKYLGIVSNSTINVISFSYRISAGSIFSIQWTDSRLKSSNCNLELLRSVESNIISMPGVIHGDLIKSLTPDVVLYDANIKYYGDCLNRVSSLTATITPTPAINSPQYLNAIPQINATIGVFFVYQIPRGAFYDNIDGDTRNLTLTLVRIDGTSLTVSSAVHFNASTQTLYGLIVDSHLQGSNSKTFTYKLVVINSRMNKITTSIVIHTLKHSLTIGVTARTSLDVVYNTGRTDVQLMSTFLTILTWYFHSSTITDVLVITFSRSSTPRLQLIITWTYRSIDGNSCNFTALETFISHLTLTNGDINPAFTNVLFPEFVPNTVQVQRHHNCLPLATRTSDGTSTYSVPTSTIKPSKSTLLPSSSIYVPNDQPPRVTSKILPLFAYFCIPFSYTVPEDLFFDAEQGNARKLKLELRTHDNKKVNVSSWLQYSGVSQVIYGLLKMEDYNRKPSMGYKYILTAADRQGQTASTEFSITIPTSAPRINNVITMQVNRVFDDSVADVNEQLLIVTKILNFFGNGNANNINIISFNKSITGNFATMKWSNCSLRYDPCPQVELTKIIDKMISSTGEATQGFKNAMLTHYVIQSITAERLGPCVQPVYTVTLDTTATTTIEPSPSSIPALPPYLKKPIRQINVTWCAPFEFQVPTNTFENTRSLSMELLQLNGSRIPESWWVAFTKTTQTLYGYPLTSDLRPFETTHYLLIATNSFGLSTNQTISLKIATPKPNPNHQLRVQATAYLTVKMVDVDVRILIWKRLREYLQSSRSEFISFNSFIRSSGSPAQLQFTFSDCSLPEETCNRDGLNSMLGKIFTSASMLNADFIMAFSPEIVITDVKVEHLGTCISFASTVYATATTSYIQSTVTSTPVTPIKNLSPVILVAIGTLFVDICSKFTFRIPKSTFYDVEDGLTRNLMLTLTQIDNTPLRRDPWISYDASSQILNGIITTMDIPADQLKFLLTATDKGGLSVSQTLYFQIQGGNRPVSSVINMTATGYFQSTESNYAIVNQLVEKLTSYLSNNRRMSIRILLFERTIDSISSLNISWTTCDVQCNTTANSELQRQLLISEDMVNPNLVIALGPSLIVTSVRIQDASCTAPTSTTSVADSTNFGPTQTLSLTTSSSTINTNTPPVFVGAIPLVLISLCSSFSTQLPSNICHDRENGFNGLRIDVTYSNGRSLSSESFLQYNQTNRKIYGIVKQSDLNDKKQIKEQFIVTCTDSQGAAISKPLPLNVTDINVRNTRAITFQSYIVSITHLRDVDIQLLWMRKLKAYLQNSIADHMQFVYFRRVSNIQAEFAVRLCHLDICNVTAVAGIKEKIFTTIPFLNSKFVAAMIPDFSLVSASIESLPSSIVCPGVVTSTLPTSFITPSPSTPVLSSTIIHDSPPRVTLDTLIINITVCAPFSQKVPDNAFEDPEDGLTRNLSVSLQHTNGTAVGNDSWIQYNVASLTIYGYINQDLLRHSSVFDYCLVARDRSGSLAKLLVRIVVTSPNGTVNYYFTTEANLYVKTYNEVESKRELAKKIKKYHKNYLANGVVFVNFVRHNYDTPRLVFNWTSCPASEFCDSRSLKAIKDKMLFSGVILNFKFIAALAPDFIVTYVRAIEDESCKLIPNTTVPITGIVKPTQTPVPSFMPGQPLTTSMHFQTKISTPVSSLVYSKVLSPSSSYPTLYTTSIPSIPRVAKLLPKITAGLCSLVMFKIPTDTFDDEGGSASLQLSARLDDHRPIPADSWITFKTNFHTFVGQATVEVFKNQPVGGYKYSVRATNAGGFYVETSITFHVVMDVMYNNHNVSMALEELSNTGLSNIDTISVIRHRIASYFKTSSSNSIGILKYARDTRTSRIMNVTWLNCSMANTTCSKQEVESYFSKMVSLNGKVADSFAAAFPKQRILRLQTSVTDKCILAPTSRELQVSSAFSATAASRYLTASASMSTAAPSVNHPPLALKALEIQLNPCTEMKYKIPRDTFIDTEDGDVRNLQLSLLHSDLTSPDCNFTLQLNQTSKQIYGVIIDSQWLARRTMLLQAKDRGGLTTTTTINFIPAKQRTNSTFLFTLTVRPKTDCQNEIISTLYNTISLHISSKNLNILSLTQDILYNNISAMFTECSLPSLPCNYTTMNAISQNILPNSQPDERLKAKLASTMTLVSGSIYVSRKCQPHIRTEVKVNITYCTSVNYSLAVAINNVTSNNAEKLRVSYTLTAKNSEPVFPWIKFDGRTLTLMAIPVVNSLRNTTFSQAFLEIWPQSQLPTALLLSINYPDSSVINFNYVIHIKMLSYISEKTDNFDVLQKITAKLAKFMKMSKNDFIVINYNRTKTFPETIGISVMPCFVQHKCNSTEVDMVTKSLMLRQGLPTYSLVESMLNEFLVQSISITREKACRNTPPIKNKNALHISVSLCKELHIQLEKKIFFDREDNTSLGLIYQLLDEHARPLSRDSWVQFDDKRRQIYGVPTKTELINQPDSGYIYLLKAIDSGGLSSNITVNINITGNITSPYEITIIFQTLVSQYKNSVDMMLDIMNKLRQYYSDFDNNNIGLISFARNVDLSGMNSLTWTNCSLPNETCDRATVKAISAKLVSADGTPTKGIRDALGSNFRISKILEENSGVCKNRTNTPPRLNSKMPTINISSCTQLQYKIPRDTFVDAEDGNTPSLFLYLKAFGGSFLPASSWIQFDTTNQTIYGIATYDVIKNQPIIGYSFVLYARDSMGAINSVLIRVNWEGNATERHFIDVVIKNLSPAMNSLALQRIFIAKTTKCLNESTDYISIAYFKRWPGYTTLSIYKHCSNASNVCDRSSIMELYHKLTMNINANRSLYMTCMDPDIKVINITLAYAKACNTIPHNTPPVVNKLIPVLNMTICQHLYFKVPNNTFFDKEDGRKLMIELLHANGQPITNNEFVQYNKTSNIIYGLITQSLVKSQSIKYQYKLKATDTNGATVNTTVLLQIPTNTSNITYSICLSMLRYSLEVSTKVDIVLDVKEKISSYLGGILQDSLVVQNYSIIHDYPTLLHICFSNCSLQNKNCNQKSIDSLRSRIFLRAGVVHPEFARFFAPMYVVNKATEYLSKICITRLTTTAPTTTSVASTPSKICLNGKNTKPKILNSELIFSATVGRPMAYYIPDDVAYDAEDGYLRSMSARLTDIDGYPIPNSWIAFEDVNKTIYISVLETSRASLETDYKFRLVVTDSCGVSVYDVFKVRIVGSVSCCYNIHITMNTTYKQLSSNISLQYGVYQHLRNYYNDSQSHLRFYTVAASSLDNASVILFTNSSISNDSCYADKIESFTRNVLYANGTAMPVFISSLAPIRVINATGKQEKHCNATAVIVPPFIPVAPVPAAPRSYSDWLWYILPFIILAFLVILCCFLFYWCTACCETCRGAKKKKADLFSGVAPKPFKDDSAAMKAAAVNPVPVAAAKQQVEEQAFAAAAAKQLQSESSTDPPFEQLYADIAPAAKDSTVPSLHKDKQPKAKTPPWMKEAASAPQEGPDSNDGPVTTGVAALPRAKEEPSMTADVASMPQQQPPSVTEDPILVGAAPFEQAEPSLFSSTPSTSVISAAAPVSSAFASKPQPESNLAPAMAPSSEVAPLPVDEDEITPIVRPGTQAAAPPRLLTERRNLASEPEQLALNEGMYQSASHLSNGQPKTILRLPSTPNIPQNEPPPPYSPPKERRSSIHTSSQQTSFSTSQSLGQTQQMTLPSMSQRMTQISPVARTESPLGVSGPRLVRSFRSRSKPKIIILDETPRSSTRQFLRKSPLQSRAAKPRRAKSIKVIEREYASPRIESVRPIYVQQEKPRVIAMPSRRSVKIRRSSRRAKAADSQRYKVYLRGSDTESDVDEQNKTVSEDLTLSDFDAGASETTAVEKPVPIEVKGVVKAPEKMLRKWFRDSSISLPRRHSSKIGKERRRQVPHGYKLARNSPDYRNLGYEDDSEDLIEVRKIKKLSRNAAYSPYEDNSRLSERRQRNVVVLENPDTNKTSARAKRDLKRGYPYSRDIYEYVDTATRAKSQQKHQPDFEDQDYLESLFIRPSSKDSYLVDSNSKQKFKGKKRNKNIEDILARLSKRKEVKKQREAYMS